MAKSRRHFLTVTSLGMLGAAAALRSQGQNPAGLAPALQDQGALAPGAPPAFGAGPAVGPEVSVATFAEAEKLVQFELTATERAVAASSWRKTMAALYERRTGPRKLAWNRPWLQRRAGIRCCRGKSRGRSMTAFCAAPSISAPLPARDEDIAFAPVTHLSRWIETRQAHLRAPHQHLSEPARAVRSQAALRHHADPRASAEAGPTGRPRDRRRPLSRTAARHPVGRQGSPRHRGDSDHVWRGAVSQPRAR